MEQEFAERLGKLTENERLALWLELMVLANPRAGEILGVER